MPACESFDGRSALLPLLSYTVKASTPKQAIASSITTAPFVMAETEWAASWARRLPKLDDQHVKTVIHQGLPARGMPAFPNLSAQELANLLSFLRTLKPIGAPIIRRKVETTSGATLAGVVLNQSNEDLELQTADRRIHLLRAVDSRFREVTSESDWPTYNGDLSGNRYTKLAQINPTNVSSLAPSGRLRCPALPFSRPRRWWWKAFYMSPALTSATPSTPAMDGPFGISAGPERRA
jgi:hypothetical protein